MLVYFVLTCVCFLSDVVSFFVAISMFGNDETEYSFAGVGLLALSALYFSLDLYYLIWIASQKMKLPDYVSTQVILALLGLFSKLNAQMGVVIEKAVKKANQKPEANKKPAK